MTRSSVASAERDILAVGGNGGKGSGRGRTHTTLDARGLNCPLPVLKARKALRSVPGDAVLEVLATDPASVIDFRHFCETSDYELLGWEDADGVFTFRIYNPA